MKGKKYFFSIGYGIKPDQITLETLHILKSCDLVYMLPDRNISYFRKFSANIEVLPGSAKRTLPRLLAAKLKLHDKIAFLSYGNPVFINSDTASFSKYDFGPGVTVRHVEAVSSFDALLTYFNLNNSHAGRFLSGGIHLIEAEAVVIGKAALDPNNETCIYSLQWLLNGGNMSSFMRKVKKAYTPEAELYLFSAYANSSSSVSIPATIKSLPALLKEQDILQSTLYIPVTKPA